MPKPPLETKKAKSGKLPVLVEENEGVPEHEEFVEENEDVLDPVEQRFIENLFEVVPSTETCDGEPIVVMDHNTSKTFPKTYWKAGGFIESDRCGLGKGYLRAHLISADIIGILDSTEDVCGILLAEFAKSDELVIYVSAICSIRERKGKLLLDALRSTYPQFEIRLHALPNVVTYYNALGYNLGDCSTRHPEMDRRISQMNMQRKMNDKRGFVTNSIPFLEFVMEHKLTHDQCKSNKLTDNKGCFNSGISMSKCPDELTHQPDEPERSSQRRRVGGKRRKKFTRKQKRNSNRDLYPRKRS